jgi:general secretion pathway protein D
LGVLLLACGSFDAAAQTAPQPSPAIATPQPLPPNNGPSGFAPQTDAATAEIVKGTGVFTGAKPAERISTATQTSDGGITLNFVNADVRDVAKAVLGDFLNLNYAVGANVQGTVTVQTSGPLSRKQVLPVLEQSLGLNGMALVKHGSVYEVVPIAEAPKQSSAITASSNAAEPGFGLEVIPLRYVGATEMQHLLEPIVPSQSIVHADTARNLLIIEGSGEERKTLLAEVALFDVDWLAGMSFALFTPKYTDANGLAKELGTILGGAASPLAGVVRLVPIERLNAVLAISTQPRYLDELQGWVNRLDKPGQGNGRRIYVYYVQNGRAADLAKVLKGVLFGTGTTSTSADAETDTNAGPDESPAEPVDMAASGQSKAPASAAPLLSKALTNNSSQQQQGGTSILADETNNALVIYATPQEYGTIESALHQLDILPLQVLLEAAIAEVTLSEGVQYGVQYFYQPNPQNTITLSGNAAGTVAQTFPGFSYLFQQGSNIRVVLNALSTVTTVKVISSPEVMVLNNHTATLQVGDQVPVATASAVAVGQPDAPIVNSISYQDTGVILKLTPRVNKGGMVMLDISQEVSDVANTTSSTLDSPTIEQRKIETSVAVRDNETIALGGLIKDSTTKGSSGIPFLSEIPVLGGLFGQKNDSKDRTELLVLITPHVVDSLDRARGVTQELRRKLPLIEPLFEKPNAP